MISLKPIHLTLENWVEKVLPELAKSIPLPGFPKDGDFTIPDTKFTINDVVTAIPGDFSFALLGIPSGPKPPEFVVAIKTADADSKEYEKSITVFDSILVKDPNNIRAIYSRGEALEHLEKFSDAIDTYNKILEDDKPLSRLHNFWTHPDIEQSGMHNIDYYNFWGWSNLKNSDLYSKEFNIQIIATKNLSNKTTEFFAIDLSKNKELWRKLYKTENITPVVSGNNLVLTSSGLGRAGHEASIFILDLVHGTEIYSKEFTKKSSGEKILIDVMKLSKDINSLSSNPMYFK